MELHAADLFAPITSAFVAGVDEAGRGPLAGPVVAAAVIFPDDDAACAELADVADSKTLSPQQREALARAIRERCQVGVAIAEPAEIDRLNILHATLEAMRRALAALPQAPGLALIDGNRLPPRLPCPARAVVGGDSSQPAIAAASIIAKTVRDEIMVQADARFPAYRFASHKGYASPAHREALSRFGPCPIHRLSYAPVRAAKAAKG